jgi:TrmH family RNA methyltransferase
LEKKINETGLIVALDSIRDPGNLGTILRLCDWFGVNDCVFKRDSDLYNQKSGSGHHGFIARVNVMLI